MANPRKTISHIGIGFRSTTMLVDAITLTYSATEKNGSAGAGLAVAAKTTVEDTVELVTTDQRVLGKVLQVEPDGACAVQIEGGCELPQGTGPALIRGRRIVGALSTAARGYIAGVADPAAAYAQAEAIRVLNAGHTVLKIADTTKAQVYLSQG